MSQFLNENMTVGENFRWTDFWVCMYFKYPERTTRRGTG